MSWLHQDNEELLQALSAEHETEGVGVLWHFHRTPTDWRCPCCHRCKAEIARKDEKGRLYCSLVEHHDHWMDFVADVFRDRLKSIPHSTMTAIVESYRRFSPTLICEDCNQAERIGKRLSGFPEGPRFKRFSFAPSEIASFIIVRINAMHNVDEQQAKAALAAVKPTMERLRDRLIATINGTEGNGEMQPIAAAAIRVLVTAIVQPEAPLERSPTVTER